MIYYKILSFLFFALFIAQGATAQNADSAPRSSFSKKMIQLSIDKKISIKEIAELTNTRTDRIIRIANGGCPDKELGLQIANVLGQKLAFPDYDGDGNADDMIMIEHNLFIK